MRRPGRGVLALAAALAWSGTGAAAQAPEAAADRAAPDSPAATPSPAAHAALSLALPGAGQYRMGQRRAWAYLGVEAAAWVVWAQRRHRGGVLRTRYRDLAWERGRIQTGARVDGDFRYYETLTQWVRSGAFDRDAAAAGVQPERDAATYNGSIWDRARRIYGLEAGTEDPADRAYQQALAYYAAQAYAESLLWDWSGRQADQDAFADLIEQSDDRFRQATAALGAVLANHVLSGVDAFVSSRRSGARASVRFAPGPWGSGAPWQLLVRLSGLP